MDNTDKDIILIIEDEAVFRLIYRGVLENNGYEVVEAVSGEEGLKLAIEKKPDLILLDLILPEISGYAVLKEIRTNAKTKDIPVIIFSIMGGQEDIRKAIELGADYYRVKGVNSPRDILDEISKVLKRSKT